MASSASILDLIARGGPMEVSRANAARDAQMQNSLAQAKHAEAAALETQAQEAKIRQEIEARKIAMADQGHVKEAYRIYQGKDLPGMRGYLAPRMSGAGLLDWQKHEQALALQADQDLKIKGEIEAKSATKAAEMYAGIFESDDPNGNYAKYRGQLQKLAPDVQWGEQFNAKDAPLLHGALNHRAAVVKDAADRANLAKTQAETAAAAQKAKQERLQNFYQIVFPGMPQADYEAAAKEAGVSLAMLPSPAAAVQASRTAGIAPEKRTEEERNRRVLAGTSKLGVTKKDQLEIEAKFEEAKARNAHWKNEETIGLGNLTLNRQKFEAQNGARLDENGNPHMDENGKPVISAQAKAIAEYRAPPPGTRYANAAGIYKQIEAYNEAVGAPKYDANKFAENNKTRLDYSPGGATGKKLRAVDTALSHLHTLSEAGQALKNGDIRVLNSIANGLGLQVGSSPVAAYETIAQMVSPEITNAVIEGAGGERERESMAKNFSASASDSQRNASISAATRLLGERHSKAEHAYRQQVGHEMPVQLSPSSRAALDKVRGGGGKGITVVDPSGKPSSPGSGHSGDENIEKLQKQFPGATITRVP